VARRLSVPLGTYVSAAYQELRNRKRRTGINES
jgi:hypothetical protein